MVDHNTSKKSFSSDSRAVTTLMETIFLLSITGLLMGMVLINYHSVYSNVQETTTRSTLSNVASKVAQDVHTLYGLAIEPGDLTLQKRLDIPERIGGDSYMIELTNDHVIARQGNKEVKTVISSEAPIEPSLAMSNSAYLVYNLSSDKIEVVNR
ncbi:MAG: hypothetical protein ACLFVI_01615 [Archaeoglobaceae archaeon]